ncbi:leucine-rich repeat-containing G-protein coupled receptor 4 like protein [Tanacetum coccineum]
MAVTHADLAPSRRGTNIGSKTGVVLIIFSILLGLLCFVLCLMAEATRSQTIRDVSDDGGGETDKSECRYSSNGKTPLICAAGAFLALAIAMMVQHTHLLISVSKSDPDPSLLMTWEIANDHLSTLTWQAAFFFITTWICFSVAEILLLIGLSVESGHLKGWSAPRPRCFIAQEGLFSSAGVFGITTVFLATGLSITALRAQWLLQDQENVRHEVMEASILYASPPRSLEDGIMTVGGETPIIRHDLYHEPGLIEYLRAFDKII